VLANLTLRLKEKKKMGRRKGWDIFSVPRKKLPWSLKGTVSRDGYRVCAPHESL